VGEIYTYNGIDYSIDSVYLIDTISAVTGCDTALYLDLTVNPLETTYLDTFICSGGVVTIGGIDYTMEGEYVIDTIQATVGCDSIRILRLEVNDFNESTITASICEGEVYTVNGIDYTIDSLYIIDTLSGPNGCDTVLYLDLTVNPLPTANAGADMILDCIVQSVTLNGSATGGTPLWTGPDINAGNQNQLMPVVAQAGLYILTVTSPQNCIAVDSVMVDLDPSAVIADAGPNFFFSCDITSVTLQGGPVGPDYSYQWSGPGINATNENDVNPVITVPGLYSLIVTDNVSQCVSLPDTVLIQDISLVIVAIIQDPDNLDCFSTTIDLDATGSSSGPNIVYLWYDEDGNPIGSSPILNIQQGGMFTFVVMDTMSGCFEDTSVTVQELITFPPVDAGDSAQIDCNNPTVWLNQGGQGLNDVIYQWTGPAGGILSTDTLLSILVGTPGYYYLTATHTLSHCDNVDSVLVTDMTILPLADIDVVENISCTDSLALLTIGTSSTGPGITYTWSGQGVNGNTATQIEPSLPGQYTLTVLNELTGCESSTSANITLPQEPQDLLVDIELPICAGDSSGSIDVLSVTGGTPPYIYTLGNNPSQSSPLFDSISAGTYTLTVIDGNGCSYSESITVVDGQVLTINIGPDLELELGESVTLWADVNFPWSQIDSIVWTPGEILSCTHCINPELVALNDATISATVYTGGCEATDELLLLVDVNADIYIPNVFSPNDDGINDHVTVFTDDKVRRVVYLEIFDRWGNQVFVGEDFAPNDPLLGWDGTFKGKKMNPAVFAYIAKVELINGDHLSRKGDITLLR
jgi:gliding motility-associated-like protein